MNCLISQGDMPSGYVAGTLGHDDVERFELHLLECAECREVVRAGAAARAVLGLKAPEASRSVSGIGVAIALATAAAIVVIGIGSSNGIRGLANVEPPPFVGVRIRASGDSSTAAVDRGIAAYSERDFAVAARELAASGDSSPGVSFYLGAALIADGQPSAAMTALRRAMLPIGNPYADEAHILAAKALLRGGHADSALALLTAVSNRSKVHAHARALGDSIRRAVK